MDEDKAASRGLAPHGPPGVNMEGAFDENLYRCDMASRWLSGVLQSDGRGGIVRNRLVGEDDTKGRAALAELLWEAHAGDDTVQTLAMLIAPDGHDLANDDLRLTIERRGGQGVRANEEKARLVGLFVWDKTREQMKVEAAIAAAQEHFGLSRRQVNYHWKTFNVKWRSHYEALRDAADE